MHEVLCQKNKRYTPLFRTLCKRNTSWESLTAFSTITSIHAIIVSRGENRNFAATRRKAKKLPTDTLVKIEDCLKLIPKRHILNFLVQHFLEDVDWNNGIVHSTTFLTKYEQLWEALPSSNLEDMGFVLLLLQIAAYSAQFLPCSTYTADTICGMQISAIRKHFHNLATDTSALFDAVGRLQSFVNVQYYCFRANYELHEGYIKRAWRFIGNAIRVAVDLGMHSEALISNETSTAAQQNGLEIELRRRIYWNLYTWDR